MDQMSSVSSLKGKAHGIRGANNKTPSTINRRPHSRGAYSKATSYSNYSRLSIDSDRNLKRRDSFDDVAKSLNDIEMRFNFSNIVLITI
jgi:hypothetical protein